MIAYMTLLVPLRRRRALRRAFRTACQAVRLDGFHLVGEQILDLSPRGALLACDREVRSGDEVIMSFRAPGRGPYLDVVGRIRRVVAGRRDGDPGYCAGLSFTEVAPEVRGELLVRLAGLSPPSPARRPLVDYAETVRRIAIGGSLA